MERDILADVNHPFIVQLNYGLLVAYLKRIMFHYLFRLCRCNMLVLF